MAIYRVSLKDASGEFRSVAAQADSEDEAVKSAETKEQKHVSFVLSPEEAAGFEKRLKEGSLSGRDKARLFSHRQLAPYKVQKVEKS